MDDPLQPWRKFVSAQTSTEFLQGWLEVTCIETVGTRNGVLLIRSNTGASLVPVAVWPTPQELSHLNTIIERCVREQRGLLEHVPDRGSNEHHLAYPVVIDGQVAGAVALEIEANATQATETLKHLHWGLGWLIECLQRGAMEESKGQSTRLLDVMEALALALQPRGLRESLFDMANDTARRLGCMRVAIGIVAQDAVKLEALSDVAWIEKSSALAKQVTAAMEEALDARERLEAPAAPDAPPAPRHTEYLESQGGGRVLTVPFLSGVDCVALMTLQWADESGGNAFHLAWLDAYAALVPSVIADKRRAQRGVLQLMLDAAKTAATVLFGPRHLIWKTATALTLLVATLMVLVSIDYRVPAKTVLEGEVQRIAAAPFDGFVSAAFARAGDIVQKDQVLARLEDRDLKVEHSKAIGERDQHERRLREAMANHEMAAAQVAAAQYQQANAQVMLAEEKISKTSIVSPFAGVVVSGDLSQTIGSPVETGKKLFEIAPLERYRVILQVDEKEIRHVQEGQGGQVVISGISGEPLDFIVTKVTPVASAADGKNTYRVEARIDGSADPRLRPGMEGIGKIAVGQRRLWWIVTHAFTDWLRLSLWNWLP